MIPFPAKQISLDSPFNTNLFHTMHTKLMKVVNQGVDSFWLQYAISEHFGQQDMK